jgi:hypothetical protein
MTKQNFIALADAIRKFDSESPTKRTQFTYAQLSALADFCQSQNPAFKRARWLDYVKGHCGPNGGAK